MNNLKISPLRLGVILVSICFLPKIMWGQALERYAVSSAGTNFSNDTYQIQFTLGETVAQTLVNGESLSQGFQQVWAVVTAVDDLASDSWKVNVYPNPTVGLLNIKTEVPLKGRLFDANGHVVMENNIKPGIDEMNLSDLPAGSYYLMFHPDNGTEIKTYHIVKIQ